MLRSPRRRQQLWSAAASIGFGEAGLRPGREVLRTTSGAGVGRWRPHYGTVRPITGGLGILVIVCVYEANAALPSLIVTLLRGSRLFLAAGVIGLNFFVMAGVYFIMSRYVWNVRGYSPLRVGLLTTPVLPGQLVTARRNVHLFDRFGTKVVAVGGLLLLAGAFIGYHSLSLQSPIVLVELIFLLQGAGMGIAVRGRQISGSRISRHRAARLPAGQSALAQV